MRTECVNCARSVCEGGTHVTSPLTRTKPKRWTHAKAAYGCDRPLLLGTPLRLRLASHIICNAALTRDGLDPARRLYSFLTSSEGQTSSEAAPQTLRLRLARLHFLQRPATRTVLPRRKLTLLTILSTLHRRVSSDPADCQTIARRLAHPIRTRASSIASASSAGAAIGRSTVRDRSVAPGLISTVKAPLRLA